MTATKPMPATILSGWCGAGYHERCRGNYGGYPCDCPHHGQPAEPVTFTLRCFFGCPHHVEQPTPQAAHDAMEQHYFEAHRADIAATVGWMAA